jgi:hypothetical protein
MVWEMIVPSVIAIVILGVATGFFAIYLRQYLNVRRRRLSRARLTVDDFLKEFDNTVPIEILLGVYNEIPKVCMAVLRFPILASDPLAEYGVNTWLNSDESMGMPFEELIDEIASACCIRTPTYDEICLAFLEVKPVSTIRDLVRFLCRLHERRECQH